MDAYRTGRGSIKLRGMAEIEEGAAGRPHRRHRAAVPDVSPSQFIVEDRGARRRPRARGHRRVNDESAKGKTPPGHRAQARRARAGHPQQPLQAHAAADELLGQHRGPRRRRPAHAEPRATPWWPTSTTRWRSSAGARSTASRRPRTAPTSSRASQGPRHDRRDHRRHPGQRRPRRRPRALMAEPFEFSESRPSTSSTCSCRRLTRLGRANLEEELAELRETIAELEAILADEVKLRGVIKDELGEIREKLRRQPRRSQITYDVGDLDIEDLIDDEDLVVTMSAKGYIKTVAVRRVPGAGPRRSRRGRRQAQGRGLRQPHHPHHGPRLPAVLLEPRPGVPPQGARDPDEGAHRRAAPPS